MSESILLLEDDGSRVSPTPAFSEPDSELVAHDDSDIGAPASKHTDISESILLFEDEESRVSLTPVLSEPDSELVAHDASESELRVEFDLSLDLWSSLSSESISRSFSVAFS